jgi:DNA-binding transcriptional MerR regulator
MNIGQAAKASGVSERVIRHYEKIGLVPPASRRDSGYRDYSPTEIGRFRFIANARDLGFPVEEIATASCEASIKSTWLTSANCSKLSRPVVSNIRS